MVAQGRRMNREGKGSGKIGEAERKRDSPLQIVWSRIFMLAIRAVRTHVAWRVVDEAVPDHFVFALEAPAAFATAAAFDGAVVRPVLRVDVGM